METYTIDAKNKKLGRVASEAAVALMGKHKPDFRRHKLSGVIVNIKNASKLAITEKKQLEKIYKTYSGYPGGLKHKPLKDVITKKGVGEALRIAIRGMLPTNTLRPRMLKNLIIEE